jgi:hypothetical protein
MPVAEAKLRAGLRILLHHRQTGRAQQASQAILLALPSRKQAQSPGAMPRRTCPAERPPERGCARAPDLARPQMGAAPVFGVFAHGRLDRRQCLVSGLDGGVELYGSHYCCAAIQGG